MTKANCFDDDLIKQEWSIDNAPDGISIDRETGTITADSPSNCEFTVTVTDVGPEVRQERQRIATKLFQIMENHSGFDRAKRILDLAEELTK